MPNMDLLKQLSEAKAHGLSKEEFFRLLDAEIKLSEHRQQTSTGSNTGSAASSADVSKPLAKFLQDVDERLKTHEQQQSARFNEYMREQQQQLQQFQQQHQQHFQLFQQQQQQQLQHLQQQHLHHLQQQQERQHVEHIQQLQQQQQQMLTQVQQFQKQLRIAQAQPSQHGGVATGYSKEHQKEKQSFETALSQVKENFHEMRNTVLNRLEEEKIYMRDELSKAQHELKADLSKVAANVTEIRQLYEELARNTQEKDSGKLERKKIMDRINASQGNVQQTIRNMVQELKDFTLKQVEEQQTIAKDRLKDEVEILQRDVQEARTDIIAVTDKECQLIKNYITCRGAIQNPKKRYVCDLCVKNFKTLINTETKVGGLPWYIEQFRSSVKGGVGFTKNGKMSVWLDYFRKPREVGLEPQSNIMGHVIASIVHLTDFKNPLIAGAETWVFNEDDIDLDDKDGVGIEVGSINCAEVLEEGLIDDNGSVFVRFEILLD